MKKIIFICMFWLCTLVAFTQNQITEYEYWIDNDIANRVKTTLTTPADDISIDEIFDFSTATGGLHMVSIRFKGSNNIWSSPVSRLFTKRESLAGLQKINTVQYWFDNNIAEAVTTTIAAADKVNIEELVDLSSLEGNLHMITYRVMGENKSWSNTVSKLFTKKDALAGIQKLNTIQYWFDNDIENAVTSTFTATEKVDIDELIDLSALSNGLHLISYRVKDETKTWTNPVSKLFTKKDAIAGIQKLNTIEYWFDNDIENAVTETFEPNYNLDYSKLIDLSAISFGLHQISFRVKDENNVWSSIANKQIINRAVQNAAKLKTYKYWFNDDIANAGIVNIDPNINQFSIDEMVDVLSIPPGSDQTISYQFKDDLGRWSVPITSTFNRIASVKAAFTADKTENCGSLTVQFTNNSTDGESYLWDFGDGNTSTEENPSHTYNSSGSYTVSLTTTNDTYSKSDVFSITDYIKVHSVPAVSLGADIQICEGNSHTFSIDNNFEQYYWNEASGTHEFTTGIAGNYTLRVVDTNGCEASDMANLSFFTAPSVDLGADVQICEGSSHKFSVADEFAQYFWNDVEGTNEFTASTEGKITLKVIDANGCEATDIVNLSFFVSPAVNLGDDVQICEGNEHTFSVTDEFAQYFWNDVEGTNEFTASTEGNITLKVIDANGCEATDVANLSFHTPPSIDLGADIQICQGNEHTFSVTDEFAQYYWNDVEGSNEFTVSTEGNITLKVIDANGCEATDVVNLSFFSNPSVDLGVDIAICEGYTHTFSVSNEFAQYYWNDVEGSHEYTASTEGSYTLRVIDVNGCETSDQVNLSINDQPVINLGDNQTACEGEAIVLSVEDNYTKYFWNNTEGSSQMTVTAKGDYQLRVVDNNGCEASDAVTVTFLDAPDINLGDDVDVCEGDNFSFTVSDQYTQYFWNNVEGNNTFDVTSSGTYTLKVVADNGCSTTDEANVTFRDLPETPVVSYNDGVLSSTYAEEYQWYLNNEILNGKTSQDFTPDQDGNYSVEVWSEYGCKSQRSETVEVILVGIEDLIKENISVYPNPTKGKVVIDLSKNFDYKTDIQLKLYDANGKLIIQHKLNPITTLDLSNYSAGLYFIHFITKNETVNFKIIKQ